ISLEECEELAKEDGKDLWALASEFAQHMLPQIFRPNDPILKVSLAREHRIKLENLLNDLEPAIFTASDSLGWVYQFWQSKRKKEVNASGSKIGADELPAVTQLFTEPYMVNFLLDNSLGAWWAGKRLKEERLKGKWEKCKTEGDCRRLIALLGVPLEYLRFVKQENGAWTPAAGTFDGWPEKLSELKALDPCCGSGHFLVAAFLMLVPMRMELEGLSAGNACDAVLRENLYGLEIDKRCVELAAFALALAAWKYPGTGGYRPLPELNVACSGLAINAKKEEWLALAGDSTNLRLALEELYKQFKDAPVLGSLFNPEVSLSKGSLFELKWAEVGPLLTKAIARENDDEKAEMGVVARGITHAAGILTNKYCHIFTNPPYLTIKKQANFLKQYSERNYRIGKHDLATVFLLRLKSFVGRNGNISIVLPQNWTFQPSYKEFRKLIVKNETIKLIARLGPGAFDSISGEIVKAVLMILETDVATRNWYGGIDVSHESTVVKKSEGLINYPLSKIKISDLSETNDFVIRLTETEYFSDRLSDHSISMRGIVSGDNEKWTLKFFEIADYNKWRFYQGTPDITGFYAGKINVIDWSNSGTELLRPGTKNEAYGRKGVAVGQIGNLPATLFLGDLYDNSTGVLVPQEENLLASLWTYISSIFYSTKVREVDQALKVTNATLVKVPFDLD
ncbi:MAG: N-6 DNA methylase, partial [Deltaproteobacteria bacterium]|nr:N-6 DNA methylase [Deltaproteobacteria bacterium]